MAIPAGLGLLDNPERFLARAVDYALTTLRKEPVLKILKSVLADIVKLKDRKVAAALVAAVVAVISPFGLNVGPDGAYVVAALVLLGTAVSYFEHKAAAK